MADGLIPFCPQNFNPRFPWGKRLEAAYAHIRKSNISIHASRGGSDLWSGLLSRRRNRFQSTLPVGEATLPDAAGAALHQYFNPRFPWGKRR